ncbi:MAG: ferredoxin [Pseudomonadota bacterium]
MVTGPSISQILDLSGTGLTDVGRVAEKGSTIILLGPDRDFWDILTQSREWKDQHKDPVDAWSERVITELARALDAEALFPFTGPPYHPFLKWAVDSGEAWPSPTGPLVHARMGLMISYRGAVRVPKMLKQRTAENPCDTCTSRACERACPVQALSVQSDYYVPACYNFLRSDTGQRSCYVEGCAVRLACPISDGAHRNPSQSAYHMTRFLP